MMVCKHGTWSDLQEKEMSGTINSKSAEASVRSPYVSRTASVATDAKASGKAKSSAAKPLVIPPDIKPDVEAKSSLVKDMLKSNKDPVQALRKALANPELFRSKNP
jgi:hypothetical protein